MIEVKTKLPDTLSGLIYTAVTDVMKAERDPRYTINMLSWHENHFGKCEVCFAGAVIAFTLKAMSNQNIIPSDLSPEVAQKIRALDMLRSGDVVGALFTTKTSKDVCEAHEMIKKLPFLRREIPKYDADHEAFKIEMLQMANELAAAGF